MASTYKQSHCTHTEYLRQKSPFLNSDSFFCVAYDAMYKVTKILDTEEV